jgi:ATP-dependent helicase/nuclease subunit B
VSDKGGYAQIGYDVTSSVINRFDHVFTVIADGIASGIFSPHPEEPASFVPFVSCPFCDPDGLGTRHRWAEWEKKRDHPDLRPYVALVEPDRLTADVTGATS